MTYPYQFQVHKILPTSLFDRVIELTVTDSNGVETTIERSIGAELDSLFQGSNAGIALDMCANTIGLFWSPGTIPDILSLMGNGFGLSPHGSIGGHLRGHRRAARSG